MTDSRTDFPHGANSQAHQLATILQHIQEEELLFAEVRAQHKATLERLHNEAYKLKEDILSGQDSLPLEPVKESA